MDADIDRWTQVFEFHFQRCGHLQYLKGQLTGVSKEQEKHRKMANAAWKVLRSLHRYQAALSLEGPLERPIF